MESSRRIRRALEYLGWEVRWQASAGADGDEAILGAYGPYRLTVRLDVNTGEPVSVIFSRVGDGGVFVERWHGVGNLPAPALAVNRLSSRRRGDS